MAKKINTPLRVAELFAGVGGFRLGLVGAPGRPEGKYQIVWSNQWEPTTKTQHASKVYEHIWGSENHCNADIHTVTAGDIPDCDLLVGGFPCQDYSVAATLKNAQGLLGKKGVLWWQIHRILSEMKRKPKFLFLENVDRLLKSPAKQRGRDFAIMLRSLSDLGYAVEWRVVNAADYGMPQRRRRVYFLGYHRSTDIFRRMKKSSRAAWIDVNGLFAHAFPANLEMTAGLSHFTITDQPEAITENFNVGGKLSPFLNSGVMVEGQVFSAKTNPVFDGPRTTLADVLQSEKVPAEYFIPAAEMPKWDYLKGAKKETRRTTAGYEYQYSEGSMIFPDALDAPSRTIITAEGGRSASRFKHVVKTRKGHRRLTPIELERLNMFPDDFTKVDGISDTKRAFLMGNALVVGVVRRVGEVLFDFV